MNSCVKYLGLPLTVCLVLFLTAACGEETAPQRPGAKSAPVRVQEVEAADFRETAEGIGSLEAPETVQVKPEISAPIKKTHVREGARVEKGERLFSLDAEKLRSELDAELAALESTKASLAEAKSTYLRFKRLFEQRTVSEEEYEQRLTAFKNAKSEVDRLRARVELMRERLDDTTISAPMPGVLSEIATDPGDFVRAGETLVTIYRLDPLQISFRLAETFMGRVEIGQSVEVRLASSQGPPCEGEVVFVGPEVDPDTRKFLVKASVCNPEGALKPGAFARAVVILDVREDRPAVPERALVSERAGYSLYLVEDGAAVRRKIEVGLRRPGLVEIAEGVSVGETVVVEGQLRLSDGAEVRIRDADRRNGTRPDKQ
jgi:membrane fusion protein (multidrug efflux system)